MRSKQTRKAPCDPDVEARLDMLLDQRPLPPAPDVGPALRARLAAGPQPDAHPIWRWFLATPSAVPSAFCMAGMLVGFVFLVLVHTPSGPGSSDVALDWAAASLMPDDLAMLTELSEPEMAETEASLR